MGTEPATFRLVAQCLNQLRHCLPPKSLCNGSNFLPLLKHCWNLLSVIILWGHPHCGSLSSVNFSSIQYSNALSPVSLCNSSLRSQLQTKRNFPTRHLSKSIHSTSHAYQICQLTNGRVDNGLPRCRPTYLLRPVCCPPRIPQADCYASRRHYHSRQDGATICQGSTPRNRTAHT